MRALDLVRFDPVADRLIGPGDLIDRGPRSLALLLLLESVPWFCSVIGNHEATMMCAGRNAVGQNLWDANDNEWSEALDPGQREACCRIASGMPAAIELPLADGSRIGPIYAEVRVGQSWPDVLQSDLFERDVVGTLVKSDAAGASPGHRRRADAVRSQGAQAQRRTHEDVQFVDGIDTIIAGHAIFVPALPCAIANLLYIDTGVYTDGGRLTLMNSLNRRYWQVGRTRGRLHAMRKDGRALPAPLVLLASYGGLGHRPFIKG